MAESENKLPPPGTISWTEIPVVDLTRAKKFYEEIFGWNFTSMPAAPAASPENGTDSDREYVLFTKGSTHGGFVQVSEECHVSPAKQPSSDKKSKTSVCVTITVDSIDETFKLIEKAGGEVYKPKFEIPADMGFAAKFLDTEKNVMGLWAMH